MLQKHQSWGQNYETLSGVRRLSCLVNTETEIRSDPIQVSACVRCIYVATPQWEETSLLIVYLSYRISVNGIFCWELIEVQCSERFCCMYHGRLECRISELFAYRQIANLTLRSRVDRAYFLHCLNMAVNTCWAGFI
jgi:hypothetical protein